MIDLMFATREEKHLFTKIRLFEDMMLRNRRNLGEVERIRKEIQKMNVELQNLQWQRNRA